MGLSIIEIGFLDNLYIFYLIYETLLITWIADPYSLNGFRSSISKKFWTWIRILDRDPNSGSVCRVWRFRMTHFHLIFVHFKLFQSADKVHNSVLLLRKKNQKVWNVNLLRILSHTFLKFSHLDPDPFQIQIRNAFCGCTYSVGYHLDLAVTGDHLTGVVSRI